MLGWAAKQGYKETGGGVWGELDGENPGDLTRPTRYFVLTVNDRKKYELEDLLLTVYMLLVVLGGVIHISCVCKTPIIKPTGCQYRPPTMRVTLRLTRQTEILASCRCAAAHRNALRFIHKIKLCQCRQYSTCLCRSLSLQAAGVSHTHVVWLSQLPP